MGTKFVQIDAYIEWPVATNRSDQFSSFNVDPVRAEIEASVFGDKTEKIEPGTFTNTLNCNVRPDADYAFLTVLVQELEAGVNVNILYRPKDAVKSISNPEMTFPVMVTKIPPIGGERNTLLEGNLQLRINGPITYDNSVVTVTLG